MVWLSYLRRFALLLWWPIWLAVVLAKFLFWMIVFLFRGFLAVARPAMRLFAYIFAIVATIALVSDVTPAMNGVRDFVATPFVGHWKEFAPLSLEGAKQSVENFAGPWAWQTMLFVALGLPTFVLFGLLGAAAALGGRRRDVLNVFVN